MKIGNLEIKGYAALAPMAGVADRAMREICDGFNAAYSVGELTSAKAICLGDRKSPLLLEKGNVGIFGSQLFGYEPEIMAEAARVAESLSPDFIDINMGCPAPKVANNKGGSGLLREPRLVGQIVDAVVKAVKIPVTVKIRSGWDEESKNAVQIAKICEDSGASAITVHGRTRVQMYAPPCDLDIIKAVKSAVKIPVIGNGDITDGKSAKYMYDYTGCDLVMVGRAANGQPWIFDEINTYMQSGVIKPAPSLAERMKILQKQIELMRLYKGDKTALLEARKHTAWYMKGLRGAAELRRMCGEINSFCDLERIIQKALADGEDL